MNEYLQDVENCLATLSSGGVILYPTDTVWGLGCDATNPEAVKKIFEIKQREEAKSLIVLMAEERDILQYVASPDLALFDYLQTREKPTTVIYDHAIGLAENVLAPDGSVGIRLTSDAFCRTLIKRFRKPIVSTSANISGQPAPAIFSQISPEILQLANYTVAYRRDDTATAAPSSIIRWHSNASPTIIRP